MDYYVFLGLIGNLLIIFRNPTLFNTVLILGTYIFYFTILVFVILYTSILFMYFE